MTSNLNGNTPSIGKKNPDFFKYWESLGFFENIQMFLPREFFLIYEIARLIATQDNNDGSNAIESLLQKDPQEEYDREKSIHQNRYEKISPLSERMELQHYKTIYDLKKTIPRELAWDKNIFDIKLLTRTLLVQRHYETEGDRFKPISPTKDDSSRKMKFEQKFYLLLDRSRSMEKRMRSFYSKSLVAEFLRNKMESNAKLFYRAFDSSPGSLVKVENHEDFAYLIEKVILTTTGGTSTNMQDAIFQAIKDINYDKDMLNSEILVVTDGLVDNIDFPRMKDELKDIKLNFLKIGRDLAKPDGYEIKRRLSDAGFNFDPFSIRLEDIKKKLDISKDIKSLPNMEQRIYEYMLECSDNIIKDLKKITYRFIEIEDINPRELVSMNKDSEAFIADTVKDLLSTDISNKTLHELSIIYKKAYFLSEYIKFLMESGNMDNTFLRNAEKELSSLKQKILSDPGLSGLVMKTEGFEGDKKDIKSARKAAKKKMKQMTEQDKALSLENIKNVQMMFSLGGGKGSGNTGLLLLILFRKLIELIKSLLAKIRQNEKHN